MQQTTAPLFDTEMLIIQSQPQRQQPWFWYFSGGILLVVLVSGAMHAAGGSAIVDLLVAILVGGFLIASGLVSAKIARSATAENEKVEAISELITLRRWPDAAAALNDLLSSPMRSQGARVQSLVFLAGVLGRYHRFEDAIHVYDYLLEDFTVDPRTEHALKLGRAMSFLRNDQLFDADRAISDLRRGVRRAKASLDADIADAAADVEAQTKATDNSSEPSDVPAIVPGPPDLNEFAGLSLLEIYRDVKTGHPLEAIELFQKSVDGIRKQYGHRVGDAYALVSRAYDLLNRDPEAKQAFEDATLMSPLQELLRRYPEVQAVANKYSASPAPYVGGIST